MGVDGRRRTLRVVVVVVVDCEEEEEENGVVLTRIIEWRERGSFVGGLLGKVW